MMDDFEKAHRRSRSMARFIKGQVDGMAFVLMVGEPAAGVAKRAFYISNLQGKSNIAMALEEMAADIRKEISKEQDGTVLH